MGPSEHFFIKETRAMRFSVVVGSIGLYLVSGCSSEGLAPGQSDDLLPPPAAEEGVQLSMVSTVEPGQEIERCKFYQVPPGGLNVNRTTVRYVAGSHHVLLHRTEYTAIPTTTRNGAPAPVADANGVFDCAEGATADWEVSGIVGGAQSAHAAAAAPFPPGVANKLAPGTVLLINTHYLNATSKPLTAEARINLYTIPDSAVTIEGGQLFFYNPFIRLHAQSTGSARMSCPITQDITVMSGQSHMHKRGTDYVANLTETVNGAPTQIYESHDWENVPVASWENGLALHQGQSIDYTCFYRNSENREIIQGQTTKDEMCMFVGSYYPRNRELEQCRLFSSGSGATFIGSGTADGATTLQCFRSAGTSQDQTARRTVFFGCIVDSCAPIANEITSYVNCQLSPSNGCASSCDGTNPSACSECQLAACGESITALSRASCN
jgi:hypothetical protein